MATGLIQCELCEKTAIGRAHGMPLCYDHAPCDGHLDEIFISYPKWEGFRTLLWCAIQYLWRPDKVEQDLRRALVLRHPSWIQ